MKHFFTMKHFFLYALLSLFIVGCSSDDDPANFSETGSFQASFSASTSQLTPIFEFEGVPINASDKTVNVSISETSADLANDVRVEVTDVDGAFSFTFSGFTVDEESILLKECTECFTTSDNEVTGTVQQENTGREIGVIITFDDNGGDASDQIFIEIKEL